MTESDLQVQVADYLRLQYPDVLFHSDYGSGIKLTPGQAVKQKRQNGGRRAWPDMFIAEPTFSVMQSGGKPTRKARFKERVPVDLVAKIFGGLFLELKKEGTRLKKKNGEWATEHIAEQSKVLGQLRQRGYCAEFAVGFDEAKKLIDEYLGEQKLVELSGSGKKVRVTEPAGFKVAWPWQCAFPADIEILPEKE